MEYEKVFESERITFIRLTDKLVQDYLTMINDIEVQKTIGYNRRTYDLEGELQWIKNQLEKNAIVFSMIEKETNEFIGNIEIMRINNNIGEMGIAITPSKQDQHFGQEAIKRFIEYAFNDLGLDGLELYTFTFNKRGIRCYENVGFIKEGPGKHEDDIHMIISK